MSDSSIETAAAGVEGAAARDAGMVPAVRTVGAAWRLSASGGLTRRLTVLCDLQERAVDADDCQGCARFIERRSAIGAVPEYVLCGRRAHDPPSMTLPGVQSPVREVMEREVLCAAPDVPVDVLAPFFARGRVAMVPVVDEAWRVAGVVEAADLLTDDGATVGEVMRARPRPLDEGAAVGAAAVRLPSDGESALPVVAEGGEVVGVLTALDLVGWMAWANGAVSHPRFTARAWVEMLPRVDERGRAP